MTRHSMIRQYLADFFVKKTPPMRCLSFISLAHASQQIILSDKLMIQRSKNVCCDQR